MSYKDKLAGIEYAGIPGISRECQEAVMRLLQFGDRIKLARILSHADTQCLLLTINNGDSVAIKSGFASGYGGEGPRRFSYVIQLLEAHKIEIEEYDVDKAFLERLDYSALKTSDLKRLDGARPVRPTRWHEYIIDKHYQQYRDGTLWQEFFPVIPFGIVDSRITDLAIDFWSNPDSKLMTGYRRLEDAVRKRTGLHSEGAKLFSQTFNGSMPILCWKKIDEGERNGRLNLFTGAYMAHRNPRAHIEQKGHYYNQLVNEFLLLNHLFILEKQATKTRKASLT